MKILTFLLFFVVTSNSLATGWVTKNLSARIKYMNPEGNVVRVHFTATDTANPDGCGQTSVVMLKGDTKNEDRQYALLLSAFMANKPIKIYTSGCVSGWSTTYPKIGAVYVYE